jgi:hypothetical protein
VLSPFAGIGSEGYEAIRLGRRFVGFELKPQYAEVAAKNCCGGRGEVTGRAVCGACGLMRHAKRTDSNHAAVRDALRARGWQVMDLSRVGHGCPDLGAWRGERAVFLEVKDGSKPPSARKLTEKEALWSELLKRAGIPVHVITSVEQIASL